MSGEEHSAYTYLRQTKKFPNVWCSGCGIGIVMGSLIRAIDRMGLDKDDIAIVSGIGCTGRMPVYMDFNTMHTTHGRALAFATGLKLAQPRLHVIVVMGDGDALAIGGNHFIHSARRNIDITAIVVNNTIYGMTGGQYSPTTPIDGRATTAPYGNIEQPLPMCELAIAAGASFVARSTVYHAVELDRILEQAIRKHGFSLVEARSYCHTTYGRINKLGSAVDMMRSLKENSVSLAQAEKLTPEERSARIVRGVLWDVEKPEYTDLYDNVIERAQGKSGPGLRNAGGH
ncbi:MAG: 2-oxoacid:ferredoxin oxidoreductase subunit beta [Chloroflexota bacterium]|nr:MAG: 2-oxoacid:ferredoxin oxidoreductase subunit beta [Chloroflexota bacterium]